MSNRGLNKIRQIVHLRHMVKKWHARTLRFKVSTINSCALSPRTSLSYDSEEECCRRAASPPPDVPEGYLAVYVGSQERRRFVIPTTYLSSRVFGRLLEKAEEEFGFDQRGALTIPCDISVFESALTRLSTNEALQPQMMSNRSACKQPAVRFHSSPLPEKSFG